jgi:hypothetical protein
MLGVRSFKEFEMNRILSTGLLILCFTTHVALAEEDEDFYSQLNRAVIRLEHLETVQKEGSSNVITQNKPDGTAFFVQSEGSLFVVSARHVVDQSYDLHARVECLHLKSGKKEVILLKLPRKQWIFHPITGDKDTHFVDVAAMRISWIQDRSIKCFRYELPDSENKDKNQLPSEDPKPPRKILVFGFPMDIGFQLLEQRPFGRAGIISMQTGKKFLKMNIKGANKFAEEKCYVIDVEVFPGNSGSPVLNETSLTDSKLQLLGMLSASNQNMDFGVVEPVSRIREVLDKAKSQKVESIEYWSLIKK